MKTFYLKFGRRRRRLSFFFAETKNKYVSKLSKTQFVTKSLQNFPLSLSLSLSLSRLCTQQIQMER